MSDAASSHSGRRSCNASVAIDAFTAAASSSSTELGCSGGAGLSLQPRLGDSGAAVGAEGKNKPVRPAGAVGSTSAPTGDSAAAAAAAEAAAAAGPSEDDRDRDRDRDLASSGWSGAAVPLSPAGAPGVRRRSKPSRRVCSYDGGAVGGGRDDAVDDDACLAESSEASNNFDGGAPATGGAEGRKGMASSTASNLLKDGAGRLRPFLEKLRTKAPVALPAFFQLPFACLGAGGGGPARAGSNSSFSCSPAGDAVDETDIDTDLPSRWSECCEERVSLLPAAEAEAASAEDPLLRLLLVEDLRLR